MKRVRLIVSCIFVILGFILSSELYQNYFRNFLGEFYYFQLETEKDRKELAIDLEEVSDIKGKGVFSINYIAVTPYESEIQIYANERAKKILANDYEIKQGEYRSLFSGKTKVIVSDFQEIVLNKNIDMFYFTGTMQETVDIKKIVNKKYDTSYVHKGYNDGNNWIAGGLWGIILGMFLILDWMVIQFERKEIFVKISMGASKEKLIIWNILETIIVYSSIIFIIRFFLNKKISITYGFTESPMLFIVFCILEIIINIIGFKSNYKEIIYGANISNKLLGNCYALKTISMIATIISVALMMQNFCYYYDYYKMYGTINNYNNYSFLSYNIDASDLKEGEELEELYARKEAKFFYEMCKEGRIVFAVENAIGSIQNRYYLVNENTFDIDKIVNKNVEKKGIYILIPSSCKNKNEVMLDAMESFYMNYEGFDEEFVFKEIEYSEFELLYFDTKNASNFGFDIAKNPIMIFCNFDFSSYHIENAAVYLNGMQNDLMYLVDDELISNLEKEYGFENVRVVNVVDRCNQYKTIISRILILNFVICIFLLLFEAIIIMTIIKLEYIVNAKELAVKKMLGYTIVQKNISLLLMNWMCVMVANIIVMIYSIMYSDFNVYLSIITSLGIAFLETIIIIIYALKIEKNRVVKILKGGVL